MTANSTLDKPVLGVVVEAMTAWLRASDVKEGAIFRRLWKWRVGHPPLHCRGRRDRPAAGCGGRKGARQGIALPAIMAMTEHHAFSSVIGYFQAGNASKNPAAHLLDTDAVPQTTRE